jgi:beta-glucosidase
MPFEEIASIEGSSYTAMNWEIYPQGLTEILLRLQRDYAPPAIVVAENGCSFVDEWDGADTVNDFERLDYFRTHIQAVQRAYQQGVPMIGYFAWSLMDNFEWAEGYKCRFGIVYVDYPTQQRVVKASGRWYAKLLASQHSRG